MVNPLKLNLRQKWLIFLTTLMTGTLGLLDIVAMLGISAVTYSLVANTTHKSQVSFGLIQLDVSQAIVFAAFIVLLRMFLSIFLIRLTSRILSNIENEFALSIVSKTVLAWHDETSLTEGELLHALTSGLSSATTRKFASLIALYSEFLSGAIIITFLFTVNIYVTISMIVLCIVAFTIPQILISSRQETSSARVAKSEIAMANQLRRIIDGLDEIIVYKHFQHWIDKFQTLRRNFVHSTEYQLLTAQLPRIGLDGSVTVALLAVVACMVYLGTPPREVMLIFVGGFRLLPSLLRSQSALTNYRFARATSNSIVAALAIKPRINLADRHSGVVSDAAVFQITDGTISYGEKMILRNISMTIGKPGITLIKGRSGIGKTSLVKILVGLQHLTGGSLTVSNSFKTLAYVPQRVSLFPGTLSENVTFFDLGIEYDAVVQSLSKSGLIESGNGLHADTRLGDDGRKLSGGELLRLGLSRALYSNADVIIVDELTSALDGKSERMILGLLRDISRSKPIIAVSHSAAWDSIADHTITLSVDDLQGDVVVKCS